MWGTMVHHEVRFAIRTLRKNPGFTAAVVLTLALGIGANTAIFSAVYGVLLRPLPVERIDRLAVVQTDAPGLGLRRFPLTPGQAEALQKRTDLFVASGSAYGSDFTLTGSGEPQRLAGYSTTGDFFGAFGVRPEIGRFYAPEESETGRENVVVLSHELWQRLCGGDARCLSRKIELNGALFQIAGVMPPRFSFPWGAELWVPLPKGAQEGASVLRFVGRMRDGLSLAELDLKVKQESARFNERNGPPPEWKLTMLANPFPHYVAGQLRPVLIVLMTTVGFVLLIACANAGGLLLVRATAREREMAVRAAIGASRSALVRQTLIESLILSAAGGMAGVLGAMFCLDLYARLQPVDLPAAAPTINWPVLIFAAAVSILSGLLFGIAPAWRASQAAPGPGLSETTRNATAGRTGRRLLSGFAVAQIALAQVLLIGSGLFIRSLAKLIGTASGFQTDRVMSARFSMPEGIRQESASMVALLDQLEERLAGVPGIEAAGITNNLPFADGRSSSPFRIPGRPGPRGASAMHADRRMVSPGYFRVMGIPLLRGRMFDQRDAAQAPPAVLIDEQLARQFFAGEEPIGRQIDQARMATIVGVVGAVKHADLAEEWKPSIYYSTRQFAPRWAGIVVRTSLDAASAERALRTAMASVEDRVALFDFQPMQVRVARSLGARRLAMGVTTAFGALSVLLSVIGIYGVISYSTKQRTQEIGIRIALGAEPRQIAGMILRKGVTIAGLGLAAGVAAALALAPFLSTLVFGIRPEDPVTISVSLAILAGSALFACYLPARRAARVEPGTLLRQE
jgi:predicted permease